MCVPSTPGRWPGTLSVSLRWRAAPPVSYLHSTCLLRRSSLKCQKNEPCDVIKMRDERRSEKEKPLIRNGSIDVTRLIF